MLAHEKEKEREEYKKNKLSNRYKSERVKQHPLFFLIDKKKEPNKISHRRRLSLEKKET